MKTMIDAHPLPNPPKRSRFFHLQGIVFFTLLFFPGFASALSFTPSSVDFNTSYGTFDSKTLTIMHPEPVSVNYSSTVGDIGSNLILSCSFDEGNTQTVCTVRLLTYELPVGVYAGTINIWEGVVEHTVPYLANVYNITEEGSSDYTIDPDRIDERIDYGDTERIRVTVENTGEARINDVQVYLDDPLGDCPWLTFDEEIDGQDIRSGDRLKFYVEVKGLSCVARSEDNIIIIESDEFEEEIDVEVDFSGDKDDAILVDETGNCTGLTNELAQCITDFEAVKAENASCARDLASLREEHTTLETQMEVYKSSCKSCCEPCPQPEPCPVCPITQESFDVCQSDLTQCQQELLDTAVRYNSSKDAQVEAQEQANRYASEKRDLEEAMNRGGCYVDDEDVMVCGGLPVSDSFFMFLAVLLVIAFLYHKREAVQSALQRDKTELIGSPPNESTPPQKGPSAAGVFRLGSPSQGFDSHQSLPVAGGPTGGGDSRLFPGNGLRDKPPHLWGPGDFKQAEDEAL